MVTVDMDEKTALAALDPAYPALSEFVVLRRDLMTLWFLAMASAPGERIIEFSWWTEGERFSADAAGLLGARMREFILSGELAASMYIHINPTVEPVAESARITLLFRELADFVLHSGGFEVQGEQPPHVIEQGS